MNSTEILKEIKTTMSPSEEKLFREVCFFADAVRLNEIRNAKPQLPECSGIHIMAMFSIILRIMRWRDVMLTGYSPIREAKFPSKGFENILEWVKSSFAFYPDEGYPHSVQAEKNFCFAIADFADYIGMSRNDFMHIFPVILRLFGVETQWSGMLVK